MSFILSQYFNAKFDAAPVAAKMPTCFCARTLDGCLHFRRLSPPSLIYPILRYGRNHNCLDSHAVREANQSVWVEASLHSHRFIAVKVLLSLAHSLWTRLVLLSEQISIQSATKPRSNGKSFHTCVCICMLQVNAHVQQHSVSTWTWTVTKTSTSPNDMLWVGIWLLDESVQLSISCFGEGLPH